MRSTILAHKRAKVQRRSLTAPEQAMWALLRRNRQQFHFRRQHPVGPFILDFYCAKAKLCVEIDGPAHLDRADPDERRTHWLNGQGIHVVRFSAEDVEVRPAVIIAAIAQAAARTA